MPVAEYVRRLYTENDPPEEPPEEPDPPPEAPTPERRGRGRSWPKRPNRVLQSRTDPEATLVDRPAFGRHLAYKAHLAVSGVRGQVITAAVATTGMTADEHLLGEVLRQHRRLSRLGCPRS